MSAMGITGRNQTGCTEHASLFQHPLLEEPPTSSAPADDRRQYQMMVRKAQSVCESCPLMKQCLYDAVARHDVAGYAGGTTRKQRMEIRSQLGITVAPEDLDTLAGVTARHRQVDHHEVIRLRNANPHESLETLAQRMGCSLSTVKRHLRKARSGEVVATIRPERPSLRRVLATFTDVTQGTARRAA
ncbi:MAG: WhiB family transcriptional regulator [Propionibacteriaceae bacterium]